MASVQAGATEAGFLALAPAPPSSPIPPHHEQLVLSILLTLAGAAALSLSLVTQRFALSYPEAYIPCCGVRLPQNLVWFGGLVLYGAANGLKVVALQWGPLSVLSCIFTTVLVFNIVLARLLLREQLTAPKVMGALIIVVGAGLASVGACQTCQTELSASEVEQLLTSGPPGGYAYVGVLIVSILVSACLICWYDARHPPTKRPPDGTTTASMSLTADITEGASVQLVVPSDPTTGAPSRWLEGVMAVVYAGSLGLDEALADLLIKAWSGILATCPKDGGCHAWILFVAIGVWVLSAFASALWWYRKVLARYETTVALPIEYGALNAASALTGLLFYGEKAELEGWQLAYTGAGVGIILVGIAVGMLGSRAGSAASTQSVSPLSLERSE